MEFTDLGSKIKTIRDKHKLSQKRFGKKIGVSGKTISAYETGKIIPTYKILEKICDVYDESIITVSRSKKVNLQKKLDEIERNISMLKNLLKH